MSQLDVQSGTLVTLAQVKTYLQLHKASDDQALVDLADQVSADCEAWTRRLFLTRTHTDETHNGDGSSYLLLNHYPVTGITSITPYEDATALTTVDEEFRYDPASGEVYLLDGAIFPTSFREVKVTYEAGYADRASLPGDLVLAMKQAVAHRYREAQKGSFSVERQEMGGDRGSVDYISTVYPQLVINVWNRHRRKVAQ